MKKLTASLALAIIGLSLVPVAAFADTPPPTCVISANPGSVQLGQTTNLSWDSANATQGSITTIGSVASLGKQGVIPTVSQHTYIGTFTGLGGTGTCQVDVPITNADGSAISSGDFSNGYDGSNSYNNTNTFNATAAQGTPSSGASSQSTVATQSAGNGLVPCGVTAGLTPGTPDYNAAATSCQLCSLASLVQRIINFLIGISIPIAAGLFAWAGWLYFTSSVVDNLGKAKNLLKAGAIGFLIAISAWLVVQTILKTVLSSAYQNWNTLACVQDRKTNTTINDLLNSIPSLSTTPPPTASQQISSGLSSQAVLSCDASLGGCYNNTTGAFVAANANQTSCDESLGGCFSSYTGIAGNSGAGTQQWSSQLQAACAQSGLSDCTIAQAIMANESSGKANAVSPAGAYGLMQVIPSTACGLDSSIAGCSTNNYNQVAQAISDPATNMRLGTQYIAQLSNQFNGDPALIAAAYNGGAKANNSSTVCGSGTAWQCQANPGYQETRNYVPKVIATYNSLK